FFLFFICFYIFFFFFFFQAEDGIRDLTVTGVQTCALPIFVHVDPGLGVLRWLEKFFDLTVKIRNTPDVVATAPYVQGPVIVEYRSEERRVGKECRSRWLRDHEKKKTNENIRDREERREANR